MFQNRIFRIQNKKVRALLSLIFVAGRAEYFMADMLPFSIGVFLGLASLSGNDFTYYLSNNLHILIFGLLITICAHYAAVWSNNLGDYELDKDKSYLPSSVDLIGKERLWTCVLLSIIIGTILIAYLSLINNTYIYAILWTLGIGISLAYSCEPLRLKKYLLLNEITRGAPLVILLPFGYYLVNLNFSIPLALYTIGLAVNLLGLFLVGEVWCYKDDMGHIDTIGCVKGYRFALNLSIPIMPLGMSIMMLGYYNLADMTNLYHLLYLIIWIIALTSIMSVFLLKIYLKREDYDAVEGKCGVFTKAGTTSFWMSAVISVIILAFL